MESPRENLWVLLDREGHVLRSGQEPIGPPQWNRTLESRFPGIKTEGLTVTPITDAANKPLQDLGGKNLHLHQRVAGAGLAATRGLRFRSGSASPPALSRWRDSRYRAGTACPAS